ncbi:energy-coupling factor transporter transmembrane protein EcfT [Rhodococcus sp. D2-41]|uniref:Energy-coupling factor transporter transmembrane protein EcfT n=1 Tax=Speluncibacter jeojiensis TaxID=2710754 RepID=A0A9X4LX70_9ACTN|nr:energy-coupling factor transporter transmembrane protein EcfT [Rhodococcus sp. D2-41]MDG3010909.1 energy-coupling factor transporter transmembrane protein EcfT [Rhodococcus sp. D2-41]MDG3013884.1 energy-coupling factor transporter transmembrane protein EcfT [Corynebacteriales bacterium D3-21]
MTTLGLYHPGRSLLHRTPAGLKLAALVVAIVALTLVVRRPWQLAPAAAVITLLFAAARLPARLVAAQLRPLVPMLVVIGAFQWIFTGWRRALVVCGVLALSMALASLVTLTTRVTEMLDVTVRVLGPLRRVGVNPDRVGLVLAMAIRCIPLITELVRSVTEARKARGLGFSLRALAVPVVVGALRSADAMGDALAARGVDDD